LRRVTSYTARRNELPSAHRRPRKVAFRAGNIVRMAPTLPASLLDDDHAAFIQGSVSIVAASRDGGNVPSIGRISGCRVAADGRRITIFLASGQAPRLL